MLAEGPGPSCPEVATQPSRPGSGLRSGHGLCAAREQPEVEGIVMPLQPAFAAASIASASRSTSVGDVKIPVFAMNKLRG